METQKMASASTQIRPLQQSSLPDADDEQGVHELMIRTLLEAGERLRLPQETTATSIIIFRRFFKKRSVTKYYKDERIDVVVTTCIFLAAKVEENPRRLRDAINVVHLIRSRQKGVMEDRTSDGAEEAPADEGIPKLDKEYWVMKERIVDTEQLLLRVLGFDVQTFQHYRFLMNYARSLRCPKWLVEVAWTLVTDSLFSPKCLELRPQATALGALYLAHLTTRERDEGTTLTQDTTEHARVLGDKSGWAIFDVSAQEVEEYCTEMLDLYQRTKA